MQKMRFIVIILSLVVSSACSQDTVNIAVGTAKVQVIEHCYTPCDTNIIFINLHENENTSVQAATIYLGNKGGTLINLAHNGTRNITYKLQKNTFAIDPNRMFTSIGRKESLTGLSKYTTAAEAAIIPLSDHLLRKYIQNKKLVIALHNNTDSAYSILSYTVPDQEGNNADKVFINEAMDSDDFILTTDSTIFQRLQEQDINVILQSRMAKDDGSLSIYAQQQFIPYINVEAQHGHIEEQAKMLQALTTIIQNLTENKTHK